MTVAPSNLIDFADRLAPDSEAASRAGVSRAYYGAYHAAKKFHASLPSGGVVSNPTEGVHGKLYQSLLAPTISQADPRHTVSRRVGAMGRHLHGLRITADYELADTISDEVRKQSVLEARKIIQIIESV